MHSGPPNLTPVDHKKIILFSVRIKGHFWKGAKCAGSVGHPMTKMLSASAGLRPPDPLTTGSARGPRWGLRPSDPRYRLVLRTRHGAPPTTDPFRALWLRLIVKHTRKLPFLSHQTMEWWCNPDRFCKTNTAIKTKDPTTLFSVSAVADKPCNAVRHTYPVASVDTIRQWREDWSSASVVNHTTVTDHTIHPSSYMVSDEPFPDRWRPMSC